MGFSKTALGCVKLLKTLGREFGTHVKHILGN